MVPHAMRVRPLRDHRGVSQRTLPNGAALFRQPAGLFPRSPRFDFDDIARIA
ncbi:hypothetical protein [Burkholderia metallica]|uniref:Uncharacterized protein n=1 Tax=Burkholderia metallica TaxID=488729 RepID=A0ABT8P3Q2_9BURK|nr:hypothetical protein [Burkholderia metallica]MDN7929710.1 hypothetical protein [Burkholderia metallica]